MFTIQQLIPVGVAPRETADLLAEHQANLAETDSRDERLEAGPGTRFGTGTSEVLVDDSDLLGLPPESFGPTEELVLCFQALGVLADLGHGRLADIDPGLALQVCWA